MSTKCIINFDNNTHGVYYAGQIVSGTAEIITSRPKTIRSIHITVNGYSEVRWTDNVRKKNDEGKTENGVETFSASEQYISSQAFVYGASGGGSIELPAGKYLFTFQTTIPPNSPTSFNGSLGQIRYEVVVTIDRPLRYDNVFKKPFTVISPLDLNLNSVYANPLEHVEEKTFCCSMCFGNKEPIILRLVVPFSGYAPGQRIKFKMILDNQSEVDCSEVKVKLYKKVDFTCRTPSVIKRNVETKIADTKFDAAPKQTKIECNEYLQIPSTTPTSLENCSIINISYSLKFITKLSGLHSSIEIKFPITIGTVPLHASIGYEGNSNTITTQPSAGVNYNSIPPPSYEEDINRKQLFKDNNEYKKFMKIQEYIPKYPVFSNINLSSGTLSKPPTGIYPGTQIAGVGQRQPPFVATKPHAPSAPTPNLTPPAAGFTSHPQSSPNQPPYPIQQNPPMTRPAGIDPPQGTTIGWRH